MRPARFFFGLLFGAMLFFAFIKLLFAAIVFLGIAALGMMAFRAIRRHRGYAHHSVPAAWAGDEYNAPDHNQAPIIVLGAPQSRPVTLAMRRRSIEVR